MHTAAYLLEWSFLGANSHQAVEKLGLDNPSKRHHTDRGPGEEEAILDIEAPAKIPVEFGCNRLPTSGGRSSTAEAGELTLAGLLHSHLQ